MENVKIDNVLKSFPEFWAAYKNLKELIRQNVNLACDGLEYMPDGIGVYDTNEKLLTVPMNDLYSLVAVERENVLGYTFAMV